MSHTATPAPSRANSSQISEPIPPAPPVTTAVRPSSQLMRPPWRKCRLDHRSNLAGSQGACMTGLDRLEGYRAMVTIREFENHSSTLRTQGSIVCSLHLSNGHEAIAVGTRAALDPA